MWTVFWSPLPFTVWNINTDRFSRENPGLSTCTTIVKNHDGFFLGGITVDLAIGTMFFAELQGVILACQWVKKYNTDRFQFINLNFVMAFIYSGSFK